MLQKACVRTHRVPRLEEHVNKKNMHIQAVDREFDLNLQQRWSSSELRRLHL
jgi:hypothetical protein